MAEDSKVIVAPSGDDVQNKTNENVRRRGEAIQARLLEQNPHMRDAGPRMIFVRPARPGQRVSSGSPGSFYPDEGQLVPANDLWANRRLRDGSLVQAEPPPASTEGKSVLVPADAAHSKPTGNEE